MYTPKTPLLLLLVVACGVDDETWWEGGDAACPDGATLHGTAWPADQPATEPDETTAAFPAKQVWCGRSAKPTDRHGRSISWWDNGQVAESGSWADGELIQLLGYDAWGRPIWKVTSDLEGRLTERTWWHTDAQKAVTGTTRNGKPDGTWTEWGVDGRELGRIEYSAGVAGEVTGAPVLLHSAPQAAGRFSYAEAPDGWALPTSPSLEMPRLAVHVVLAPDELVVDGVSVLRLVDGALPPDELRGQMIVRLYDRLLEKAETAKDLAVQASRLGFAFEGDLLLSGYAETPFPVLRSVLYTAGQAQFSSFHIITSSPGQQWPPRSGPEQLQGMRPTGQVHVGLPRIGPPMLGSPTYFGKGSKAPGAFLGLIGEPPVPAELPPPPTTVQITASGYELAGAELEVSLPCSSATCAGADDWDTAGLVAKLREHRAAHPSGEPLIIVPAKESTLQHVVTAVSAVQTGDEAVWPDVVLAGGHQ